MYVCVCCVCVCVVCVIGLDDRDPSRLRVCVCVVGVCVRARVHACAFLSESGFNSRRLSTHARMSTLLLLQDEKS